MDVAISPYHLTTREPPVMTGLMVSERALTLMPAPADRTTVGDVRRAVGRAPRYYEFMESWSWSMPLWREGVLGSPEHIDTAAPMREAIERVRTSERFAPLQAFMREGLFTSEAHFLELIARDVLRGGPDPGVTVPVCAGLDAFAAEHGLVVARAAPTSLAQRAEARLGRRAFSIVVPMMIQAPAERVLEARDLLAEPIERLRDRMHDRLLHAAAEPAGHANGTTGDRLTDAARAYTEAFELEREPLREPIEEDVRIITGLVSITGMILPADAVLRSSVAAARSMGRAGARPASEPTTLPAVRDALADRPVMTLIVRALER